MTLYPITKCTPQRACDILERYGTDRIMANSAGDWGKSDPLAVPELILEMRRRGHAESEIRKVVHDNPAGILQAEQTLAALAHRGTKDPGPPGPPWRGRWQRCVSNAGGRMMVCWLFGLCLTSGGFMSVRTPVVISLLSAPPMGIKIAAPSNRGSRRLVNGVTVALALLGLHTAPVQSQQPERDRAWGPWGISSSAGSMRNCAEWLPKMSAAGVTTVRLFPEWRDFEPTKGTWKWDRADALVEAAARNNIEINAILMGSPPGDKRAHAFPMDDLDGWSNFVTNVVGRYKKHIRCWEVWNEGNGGFNDGKHTTADYAKLASATYTAARKADPTARIGLSVASFDVPYLNQAILAMAKEGKPGCFDYLCIHPYEIADHLGEADGEIPFLWMTKTMRDMLRASALPLGERAG